MKNASFICSLLSCLAAAMLLSSCVQESPSPEKPSADTGWLFTLSDDSSFAQTGFDDTSWRMVDLPHDWAVEAGYREDSPQGDRGGYLGTGTGWYRRHFQVEASALEGRRHFVGFDAIYMNSEVWINGHYLGKRPYGYISFLYELTPYVKAGENVIAVRVDNLQEPSARWYHGCGIYGHAYLWDTPEVRIADNGIVVTTPEVSPEKASVKFTARLDAPEGAVAEGIAAEGLSLNWNILSPKGRSIASGQGLSPEKAQEGISAEVSDPQLWSPETPSLYRLELQLLQDGQAIEERDVRFGIRKVEWRADTGFWLNGRNVRIHGVCEHLEGGPVGAAWTEDLLRWKISQLQKMGVNSIRTAHNPQVPMFYDLCDEMGMMVMDEAFDGWSTKAEQDYGHQAFDEWWERDLRAFIQRDRNHPSIIIWSVGNETHGDVSADLVRVCHEEDPTRLVTSGRSGTEDMDVLGRNGESENRKYMENYESDGRAFVATEAPHSGQVRSMYRTVTGFRKPNHKEDPYIMPDLTEKEIFTYDWSDPASWSNAGQGLKSSYDNNYTRHTVRHSLQFMREKSWYSGSYRWTGFDYYGEAGYSNWPWRGSQSGALDFAGLPKDLFYIYQGGWTTAPMAHIYPHWTHPYMKEGTEIPVFVSSNAEEVELFQDGTSLGRKKIGSAWDESVPLWRVPWKPGKLKAVAYKGGRKVAEDIQTTAGHPSVLGVEQEEITFSSEDVRTFILTFATNDADGVLYPYGENRVNFNFQDNIEVESLENGNPVDVERNWHASSRKPFFGLFRAFLTVPSTEKQALVRYGSILGDKKLKLSDKITISTGTLELLSGKETHPSVEIRYTLDGTEPSGTSTLYEGSFSVKPETLVKAAVWEDGECILKMEEKFGKDEGIWWNTGEKKVYPLRGIQAENSKCTGFGKTSNRKDYKDFKGKACMKTVSAKSSVSYYVENAGDEISAPFFFSFMLKNGGATFRVYNNGRLMGEKVYPADWRKSWRTYNIPVALEAGANHLLFEVEGEPGNALDWFEVRK